MHANGPLDLIRLNNLMTKSNGSSKISIGIIDGPVDLNHSQFMESNIKTVYGSDISCRDIDSLACRHGTFILGILTGERNPITPALCPQCNILLRPIFLEDLEDDKPAYPKSSPRELADAITELVDLGANIINLSIGTNSSSLIANSSIYQAYDHALRNNVLIVLAAGNQGTLGYNPLINHPWIIPVVSCDSHGIFSRSNLGLSVQFGGIMAPGVEIHSTLPNSKYGTMSGTSVAAPFVTGTLALIWSLFPTADPQKIKYVLNHATSIQNRSIIPNLLNAEGSYTKLKSILN